MRRLLGPRTPTCADRRAWQRVCRRPENVLLKVEPGKPHGIIGKVTE